PLAGQAERGRGPGRSDPHDRRGVRVGADPLTRPAGRGRPPGAGPDRAAGPATALRRADRGAPHRAADARPGRGRGAELARRARAMTRNWFRPRVTTRE